MLYENNFLKFELIGDKDILLITVLKASPTRGEFDNFLIQFSNIYEAFYKKKQHFSLVTDIQELGMVPLTYFNELKNFFLSRKEYTEMYLKCTSIITTNHTVKTIFNSFLTIYSTIKPVKFVNNIDESYEFINCIKIGERQLIN